MYVYRSANGPQPSFFMDSNWGIANSTLGYCSTKFYYSFRYLFNFQAHIGHIKSKDKFI